MSKRKRLLGFRVDARYMFAAPFIIFLIILVVFPLSLLFWHAFTDDGSFTFAHFQNFFNDPLMMRVVWRSLWIALLATVICLVIAYPIAYALTILRFNRSFTILMLFILPMWINLLLRSFALRQSFHLIGLYDGLWALIVAIVIDYLPLMILPIYVVLGNVNRKLIEASQDLGANPFQVFTRTILPLSVPGVIAGFILVFTPSVSTFFLGDYFGDNSIFMFGQLLNQLLTRQNFSMGSVLSIVLLVIVALAVIITNRFTRIRNKRGGLW